MMRLLFLCLLLLLPAATAVSEEFEGSADDDQEDGDEETNIQEVAPRLNNSPVIPHNKELDTEKTTSAKGSPDQLTLILIIVAVAVLTLSGAAIVTTVLVRRHMRNREQGIYFVPTEQDQKGAV